MILSLNQNVPNHDTPIIITRDIPMRIKRRGVEICMVIGDINPERRDPVLIKTIARARCWYEDYISGRVTTLAELTTRHGVDNGYVSHVLGLAFLAPDIVEDILSGRQPADLTAQKLLRRTHLPLDWTEQKRLLGYR